jgi:CheY-like chemotaxis protein
VLFQRFGQADTSGTREHGGAGLGLAICNDYLRLMGGELDCRSAPDQGSVFSFELTLPVAALIGETGAPAAAGGLQVLVVDDNAVNRRVAELILDSAGIEHASAVNGQEALEAVTGGGFDAVLMDIQMPVMDGLEATRRIRAWERETGRARTPIIIVSANGLTEHVDAGRAAGADDHVAKPVSAASLLGALSRPLEPGRAAVA